MQLDNARMDQVTSDAELLARVEVLRQRAQENSAGAITVPPATVFERAYATAAILEELGVDAAARAAAWLVEPAPLYPIDQIRDQVDPSVAHLVGRMRQLLSLSSESVPVRRAVSEQESLRRMLLAMADDIRVVLLFLAWRLQTLRQCVARRETPSRGFSEESLRIIAPLANRLGLWQLKWEIEDLAFRFLEPDTYRTLARQLENKRAEREVFVELAATQLSRALSFAGVAAEVTGRPKHLYSIHKKMQQKSRALEGILDLRGLRVIVETVTHCYAALDVVHQLWSVIESEFDDYIAKPKANGYRSLHTVVNAQDGLPLEVQIRTRAMHEAAEYGLASHWRYKEASASGSPRGRSSGDEVAETVEWVRALLAWQRDVGQALGSGESRLHAEGAAPVYALTPQGRVIELPAGATPIDFAYHVHSSLGHRCRGARVNGQLVPLNRPLETGQTVEILTAQAIAGEGPSRDWLNPALRYVVSQRARTKVRQWFHALELERDQAVGRERIERVLQREGRTALSFEELARRLQQTDPGTMFVAVAREEIGPRQIEEAVRWTAAHSGVPGLAGSTGVSEASVELTDQILKTRPESRGQDRSGVLVVGVDSLMSQLARCCRPVPPDRISGFVTRGRGVSVHRSDCPTLQRMSIDAPERVIETDWDPRAMESQRRLSNARFAADIEVLAQDRQGLLRDISEVFARDRINVTEAQTVSRNEQAKMRFTIEVIDAQQLVAALSALRQVIGVSSARRRNSA